MHFISLRQLSKCSKAAAASRNARGQTKKKKCNQPQVSFSQALFQVLQGRLRIWKLDHDVEQLVNPGLRVDLELVVRL
jgi:hypothetical protein